MRGAMTAAVGLGSFLLFCCEPMAAKELLPVFGGAAAVWLTCLVFFQGGVLAGYGYAGWLTRAEFAGSRMAIHGLMLVVCVGMSVGWAAGVGSGLGGGSGSPMIRIFGLLMLRLGVPFVVLGATTPLLQVWWARARGVGVPYRLFGVSNAASLGALVLYPVVVEPYVSLGVQRWWWCGGVVVFCGLTGWVGWRVSRIEALRVSEARRGVRGFVPWWFLLPLGGALQLSAVTEYLTQNVAAMPLLWVLPLAAYLLSFVVAFELPGLYRRGVVGQMLGVMLAGTGYLLLKPALGLPLGVSVGILVVELFCACWMLHAETYTRRPAGVGEVARFYLWVAAGGVVGSALVGMVAPLVFSMNYDLALVLLVTAGLVLAVVWRAGGAERVAWGAGCLALVGMLVAVRADYGRGMLLATRNFYGSLRVRQTVMPVGPAAGAPMRVLLNGSIEHGTEVFAPGWMVRPTTYYGPGSGVGLVMAEGAGRSRRIGVVGLGVGTMAAFGRAGDEIRFYEIDPAVKPVAENLFAYVRGSGARVTVVEGDGRRSLERESEGQFDVLVVDAFAGDAIPLHLLTMEAMRLYQRKLAPGGVMAFHVSNQFVDLAPEVAALAGAVGMEARSVTSVGDEARGEFRATWVVVAGSAEYFEHAGMVGRVNHVDEQVEVWRDGKSSLLRVLRW